MNKKKELNKLFFEFNDFMLTNIIVQVIQNNLYKQTVSC